MKKAILGGVVLLGLAACAAQEPRERHVLQFASGAIPITQRFLDENVRINAPRYCRGRDYRVIKVDSGPDRSWANVTFECL